MNISKKRNVADWLFISLMSWYPLSSLINFLFASVDVSRIYLMLSLLFLMMTVSNNDVIRVLKKTSLILMIWFFYLFMFYYHTELDPVVSQRMMKGYLTTAKVLSYKTFFFMGAVFYVCENVNRLNHVLHNLMLFGTTLSLILLLFVLYTEGLDFFLTDALQIKGTSVTLIQMSYNFVVFSVLSIFVLYNKNRNDASKAGYICFIICLLCIMFMGKRGALLSVIGPVACLILFANKTWQKSLSYITLFIILYFIVIQYIDYIFDFMSLFSERLAEQSRLAYYFGDTHGRDYIWDTAISQINRGLLFGYYPVIILDDTMSFSWGLHPHNIFLESIMTMGIVGSIPFFLFIISAMIKKIYRFVIIDSPYRFFGLLFIAEIIHNCFSGTLHESWIWPLLFIFSCVPSDLKTLTRHKRVFMVSRFQ